MATENIGFWTIALPAITALLGSAIGFVGTYFVTKNRNKHERAMRKQEFSEAEKVRHEEWERSEARRKEEWEHLEIRRKEERHFELKRKAYEEVLTSIKGFNKLYTKEYYLSVMNTIVFLDCYGSQPVIRSARAFCDILNKNVCNNEIYEITEMSTCDCYKILNEAMREDLASHFKHIK